MNGYCLAGGLTTAATIEIARSRSAVGVANRLRTTITIRGSGDVFLKRSSTFLPFFTCICSVWRPRDHDWANPIDPLATCHRSKNGVRTLLMLTALDAARRSGAIKKGAVYSHRTGGDAVPDGV